MGSGISLIRQCELVGLARSSYYYRPAERVNENETLFYDI